MRKVGKLLLGTVRYSLFAVMMLLSRLVEPVLGVVAGLGVLVFGGCLLFARHQTQAMFGGLAIGVGAMMLMVAWHLALQALAPDGVVVVSDL